VTTAGTPLGGHLVHAIPLLVPVLAFAAVLLPDLVRNGWRSRRRRPTGLVVLAVAATVVAGVVHIVVMPEHFEESALYGSFFVVLAVGQAAYAWCLLVNPSRPVLAAGVLGNAAVVVLWLVTRTVGLPFGPFAGEVEPVGLLDLVAVTAELTMIGAAAMLLARVESSASHDQRAEITMRSSRSATAFDLVGTRYTRAETIRPTVWRSPVTRPPGEGAGAGVSGLGTGAAEGTVTVTGRVAGTT
jgi:hypothetical protein